MAAQQSSSSLGTDSEMSNVPSDVYKPNRRKKKSTQTNSSKKAIHRYNMFRRDMSEFNFGIDMAKLVDPKHSEWHRVRKLLKQNKLNLQAHIDKGQIPLFGYPAVLYETNEALPTVIYNHINVVQDLVNSLRDEQDREQMVLSKFGQGVPMHKSVTKRPVGI